MRLLILLSRASAIQLSSCKCMLGGASFLLFLVFLLFLGREVCLEDLGVIPCFRRVGLFVIFRVFNPSKAAQDYRDLLTVEQQVRNTILMLDFSLR